MGQDTGPHSLLYDVLDAAIAVTGAQMGNVQLRDRGKLKIVAQRGFSAPFLEFFAEVENGHAACGEAMRRRAQIVVEDVTAHPIFVGNRAMEVLLSAGVRAVQSTPMVDSNGELLGMLSTHYQQIHRPDDHQLQFLRVLARGAAACIERDVTKTKLLLKEHQLDNLAVPITSRTLIVDGNQDSATSMATSLASLFAALPP